MVRALDKADAMPTLSSARPYIISGAICHLFGYLVIAKS